MRSDFIGSLRRLLPPMYLMGDDLTLAMFTWLSGHPKVECEVQLYAMVDQVAAALDAIEFNVLVAQCKNCNYFVGKIGLSWT